MAITFTLLSTSPVRFQGLLSDTKPTTYEAPGEATKAVPVGSTFDETDTGNRFRFNGASWNQASIGGAMFVSGLARKATTGPETEGTYSATQVLGFNVLNVGTAASWVLTYVDGGVSTIGFADMREGYFPAHLNSLVIPAGGVAEVFIP